MEEGRNQYRGMGGEQEKGTEVQERGLFDRLGGKKEAAVPEEETPEESLAAGMEKVTVAEPEKKESLLSKLHRSHSSSSSSSDEEEEVIGEHGELVKRKKKKGLKEKIKEKLPGHKNDGEPEERTPPKVGADEPVLMPAAPHGGDHDTAVPVEKVHGDAAKEDTAPAAAAEEEKKGFLDKIMEKLPGGHRKSGEEAEPPAAEEAGSAEGKEKKGILGKIMEKLPGYNKGTGEEEKVASANGDQKTSA